MATINVYILTDDPNSNRALKLANVFSDPCFNVIFESEFPSTSQNASTEDSIDTFRVVKTLKDAETTNPNGFSIHIKDSSVTQSSPSQVTNHIKHVIKSCDTGIWDICYLCRWLDRCDLHTKVSENPNSLGVISKTVSPQGFQAQLVSPKGRDLLLGNEELAPGRRFLPITTDYDSSLSRNIELGRISAITFTPNLFEFDASLGRNDADYAKLSECRRPSGENDGLYSLGWFLVVILFTIILAWFFLNAFPSRWRAKSNNS
jgi:hypothetical protein